MLLSSSILGKTGSGKKFFHNVITGAQFAAEPYYAAIITPIIHYCMGGLEITTKSEVVGSNGKPIPGLFCAGECMVSQIVRSKSVQT